MFSLGARCLASLSIVKGEDTIENKNIREAASFKEFINSVNLINFSIFDNRYSYMFFFKKEVRKVRNANERTTKEEDAVVGFCC